MASLTVNSLWLPGFCLFICLSGFAVLWLLLELLSFSSVLVASTYSFFDCKFTQLNRISKAVAFCLFLWLLLLLLLLVVVVVVVVVVLLMF